jgi:hypothetical protein
MHYISHPANAPYPIEGKARQTEPIDLFKSCATLFVWYYKICANADFGVRKADTKQNLYSATMNEIIYLYIFVFLHTQPSYRHWKRPCQAR